MEDQKAYYGQQKFIGCISRNCEPYFIRLSSQIHKISVVDHELLPPGVACALGGGELCMRFINLKRGTNRPGTSADGFPPTDRLSCSFN